ncbi:helix-turn-helix transcriptional regulator [Neotabrizicola shimadae]|uniref:AlpA family phage regulatory protein n=1 Tax=Neotabrizicola shimadae TaxID=2807096 RepID=A0A8G0ZVR1_9RHOB|nr:AlpA family phage regulatory protein [Neotabrizicola shimadae]QYZ68889.1 AlpA family phage regulatory protein [Neotabrizicola shimadae]
MPIPEFIAGRPGRSILPPVYLADRAVARRYGVHRSTPWRWLRSDPSFPKPVSLSPGCTRWRLEDLEVWEQGRADAIEKAGKP